MIVKRVAYNEIIDELSKGEKNKSFFVKLYNKEDIKKFLELITIEMVPEEDVERTAINPNNLEEGCWLICPVADKNVINLYNFHIEEIEMLWEEAKHFINELPLKGK